MSESLFRATFTFTTLFNFFTLVICVTRYVYEDIGVKNE